jgi:hypothetical protein
MCLPLDLQLRICSSRDDVGFIHQPQDTLLPRALRSGFSFLFLLFPLLNIFLISCGGLVSSGPPPPVIVTVSPASAQPFAGTSVPFTATVQNAGSTAVFWQVNGQTGGDITTVGGISVSGLYTAPNSVPTPQATVTVTAVLQSDSTRTASSNVTIQPLSAIQGQLSLSPSLSSVTASQTLQLQVASYGLSNNQVNWRVDCMPVGNCSTGTITPNGLYTPPNAAGPHINIITAALPNALGSATIEVTDFPGTFTWRNDNSRSGQNQQELALAPATVTSSTFGRLFSCLLDGNAYAQPLYVANLAIPNKGTHNVVLVATEKDSVIAFDADANANPCVPLWQTSVIPAGEQAVPAPNLDITSADIAPFIGITGTPVIDVNSSSLYVVAETQSSTINPDYFERLYALDLATGQPEIRSSGIQISTPTSLIPTFSALLGNQRAALLLDNGTVYIAFGSHRDAASISAISRTTNVVTVTTSTGSGVQVGANVTIAGVTDTSFDGTFPVATQADSTHFTYLQTAADASSSGGTATPASPQGDYHGWLLGYDPSTLQQTSIFDATPSGEALGGGIWQSGGGPTADSNHNVFVISGNGTFNVNLGGPLFSYGDSFLRLSSTGGLTVTDYFTPCDEAASQNLGSSAPVLLPDSAGSVSQPHLMMGGAKNGSLYVLNRDSLGGYIPPCPDSAARVQVVPVGGAPILSTPLFWNNTIYVAAGNDTLKAFPMPGGVLNTSPLASQSPETLGPQGATPVVSSNGPNNSIIWLIDTSGALATPNTPAILRAFDAGNLSKEIYNSAMLPKRDTAGLAVKFTVPTVANGKVYVGTQTELDVYGLLP